MPSIAIPPCETPADYLESLRLAGGTPQVLRRRTEHAEQDLAACDGLLLPGGVDINPARYGQAPHPAVLNWNDERDAHEIALVRAAIARDLPVLAVCRGLQLLNVALGGSLIQDLPSRGTPQLDHSVLRPRNAIAHEVCVPPGSLLHRIMCRHRAVRHTLPVNSRHHQAIDAPAGGLKVTATAPDGIIEAVELDDMRFCLAVQWHPENFWRSGEFLALFAAFVAACR